MMKSNEGIIIQTVLSLLFWLLPKHSNNFLRATKVAHHVAHVLQYLDCTSLCTGCFNERTFVMNLVINLF